MGLSLQFRQLLGNHGAVIAIDGDDNAECDRHLGSSQAHNEEHKNLTYGWIMSRKAIKGHEVQRSRRENQFSRNEHANQSSPANQTIDPDGQEKSRGD